MYFLENINIALRSIRSNLLRGILTMVIIAFGIMALVGILTAIDVAIYSLNSSFSGLGANSFNIAPKDDLGGSRGGRRSKIGEPITFKQAMEFKDRADFQGKVSASFNCTSRAAIKYGKEETSPTVRVMAIDENYLDVKAYEIEEGRPFTRREVLNGSNRALIGHDLVTKLFDGKGDRALDKSIAVGNLQFKVAGVLKKKGTSMNQSEDNVVLIPLLDGKRYYSTQNQTYEITVSVPDATKMEEAMSQSIGLFRNVRRLKAAEENDFEIFNSESLVSIIKDNTTTLRGAAGAIGLMTLLGAAIGLMNIMLVSVTERTREVGICKALGATKKNILWQFLTEAIVICQLGGLLGIIFGVAIGVGVAQVMGGIFVMPWKWIFAAIVVCMAVGLASGIYPAMKAARLDPIEALRHE
jgi:putative ABC transport system permease protein